MTFFAKDCTKAVSAPVKNIEELATAVESVFETRPYVGGAAVVEPFDFAGDKPVELLVFIDWRFGVPHRPWAATGCEEFEEDLAAALSRDVEAFTNHCEKARSRYVRERLKVVYERPGGAISAAERYLNSARQNAQIAAAGQSLPRDQADNICFYSARTVGQSLLACILAFNGRDIPTSTLPEILTEAERVGVLSHKDELVEIAKRLEAGLAKREAKEEVSLEEALRATADAERAADILHEERRPAVWVPVIDQRFLKMLRDEGLAPAAPKFKEGDRVEFWKADREHRGVDARRIGTVYSIDDRAGELDYRHGSWWTYNVECSDGVLWKDLAEDELVAVERG